MDSEIRTQSMGEKRRAGDLHLAFVAEKTVAKAHHQWRHLEMTGEIDTRTMIPLRPLLEIGGDRCYLCVCCRGPQQRCGAEIDGGRRTPACVPDAQGEAAGIGCVGLVQSLFTCGDGNPDHGSCGYKVSANLGTGGRREKGQGSCGREGLPGSRSSGWQCGQPGLC